jgi:hypothetical protein
VKVAARHDLDADAQLATGSTVVADRRLNPPADVVDGGEADLLELWDVYWRRDCPTTTAALVALIPLVARRPAAPAGPAGRLLAARRPRRPAALGRGIAFAGRARLLERTARAALAGRATAASHQDHRGDHH